ncbi:MAG: clostripain-related cysteine peptidase [bacterium]
MRFFILLMIPLAIFCREWTVMVYMPADNSLSAMADSDLIEMKAIGSNDELSIIVQVDRPYVGANRFYVAKDTLYDLAKLGVIDMCDWRTLADFINWSVIYFPAKRYFLILWDHGTGWTLEPLHTFGSDWSAGTEMSIANGDLNRALKSFYDATNKKLNIIGFDACNMQQIEIVYEIKDFTKFCLAPQTVWPITGYPYESIFYIIKQNPGINESELLNQIVDRCKEYYSTTLAAAISAINLENLGKLKNGMKNLEEIMQNPPDSGIRNLRNEVQPVSLSDPNPVPEDNYVDLGDFLRLLKDYYGKKVYQELYDIYNQTIIKSASWGVNLQRLTGITTFFPDQYNEFKNLLNLYLLLDYNESRWANFLNWFYDQDDIKPTQPQISVSEVGNNNDFRLLWTKSFDLAPIFYNVIEGVDTVLSFYEPCEDSSAWLFNGFSLVKNIAYDGQASFFSGNSSNLNNSLITKTNLVIDNLGILDFYIFCNTEDMIDSLVIEYAGKKYTYYGRSAIWQHCRLILPPGNEPLKIYYRTNESINNGGVYIDEIRLYNVISGRYIRNSYCDTVLYVFNKLRGDYYYCVEAQDKYGNQSNLSDFVTVSVTNFAIPYSVPNPFRKNCEIFLDLPDDARPTVYIYSIAGRLIKKFETSSIINNKIFWDGKDTNHKEVGAGIYFVLVKDKKFSVIGKIARQK